MRAQYADAVPLRMPASSRAECQHAQRPRSRAPQSHQRDAGLINPNAETVALSFSDTPSPRTSTFEREQLRALIVEMAVRRWVLGVLPLRSMCAFALMIVRVVRVRPPFAKGADS